MQERRTLVAPLNVNLHPLIRKLESVGPVADDEKQAIVGLPMVLRDLGAALLGLHVVGMSRMRYFGGSFWTPVTDTRLQQLEAEGLSAAKIAAKLGTTRGSVISRSQRLRGLHRTFPSFLQQEREARARSAARQKERKRKMDAVLSKLRQEIARGIARNEAIIRARKAGATLQAIGDVVGLTREWVRQISIDQ
jgi:GcrA cell cycle regulator